MCYWQCFEFSSLIAVFQMVQFLSSTLSTCCDSDCDFLSFLIHFLNLDLDVLEPCTFSPSLHYEEPHMICFSLQRMPSGLLSIENSFPLLPHCYCHNRRLLGYRRTIDDFLVHLYSIYLTENKTKQKHCALLFFLTCCCVSPLCTPSLRNRDAHWLLHIDMGCLWSVVRWPNEWDLTPTLAASLSHINKKGRVISLQKEHSALDELLIGPCLVVLIS